jgi:hypothetical protein
LLDTLDRGATDEPDVVVRAAPALTCADHETVAPEPGGIRNPGIPLKSGTVTEGVTLW